MFRITIAVCLIVAASISHAQQNIPPERPFTLLLLTFDGGRGAVGARDPREQAIRQMIYAPRSPQMQSWAARAAPKELAASSPIAVENHPDILRRAQSLPILALIESSSGAVWAVMSGESLPKSEEALAKQLDVFFAATVQAASEQTSNAVQSISRPYWDQQRAIRAGGVSSNEFIDFPVKLPEGFDLNANATVDPETQAWGTRLTILVLGGVLLLSAALIAAAWIVAEAMTDDK